MTEPSAQKPPKKDYSMVVVVLLLLGAAGLAINQLSDSQLMKPNVTAPGFAFTRFEGGTVSSDQLKGRVVMLDFWATWCPPCREEMPYLVKVAREYEAKGVSFVAVSHDDPGEARQEIANFARTIPGLSSYAAYGNEQASDAYLVEALPTLYVIDGKGRVVASHQGLASERSVRKWLDEALAQ